jgi:hypothetical protein
MKNVHNYRHKVYKEELKCVQDPCKINGDNWKIWDASLIDSLGKHRQNIWKLNPINFKQAIIRISEECVEVWMNEIAFWRGEKNHFYHLLEVHRINEV